MGKKKYKINYTQFGGIYKNILSSDPTVYVINNFLTKEECEHIINISKDNMERAMVTADISITNSRTNDVKWIVKDHDDIILRIIKKISDTVYDNTYLDNISKNDFFNYAEKLQVIRYYENQEYKHHHDGWEKEKLKKYGKEHGQRLITTLVYLSNVEKGGETDFPKINTRVNPEIGKMEVFHNCKPKTNILHDKTYHAGLPIIKGVKWAFNLWFRENKMTDMK